MSQNLWTYMVSRYHDLFRVFLGPVPREFLFAPPGASANPKKPRHPRKKGAVQNSNHVTVEPLQNKESKQTKKN